MKFLKISISLLLLMTIIVNMISCVNVKADDLMKDISANNVNGKPIDDFFIESMANFSVELFKKTIADKENSLISPLSVMLALAMTANGADNETLSQMEKLLGGEIPLTELNEYLYSYVKSLPNEEKSKLNIANSIWFRDDKDRLQVKNDFLQTNADYYNAAAYKSAFDNQTIKDINNWVKSNTDGTIDKIIDEIDPYAVMYLINAVVFDAEWENVYYGNYVRKNDFTNINGIKQNVDFMNSSEYGYIDDGKATGFIKDYHKNNYNFVALLPNEDIAIEEYIQSLTGTELREKIQNAEKIEVKTYMPKFEYEYEISMNEALKILGIPDAFDENKADFNKMATSSVGNIYIAEVLHKTYISVDETGTKAGAITIEQPQNEDADIEIKTVRLDRPFIYAIIDNATNLPVFIGTVMTIN